MHLKMLSKMAAILSRPQCVNMLTTLAMACHLLVTKAHQCCPIMIRILMNTIVIFCELTPYGLVTPWGDTDLGQHLWSAQ